MERIFVQMRGITLEGKVFELCFPLALPSDWYIKLNYKDLLRKLKKQVEEELRKQQIAGTLDELRKGLLQVQLLGCGKRMVRTKF